VGTGGCFSGGKAARGVKLTTQVPSSADLKNAWSYTSSFPHARDTF